MRTRSNHRRGFSLIELLVVIAVIGVLISLLLPALGKAHEQARLTKCLAHCQQMVGVLTVYAGDFKGWFPVVPVAPGQSLLEHQYRYGGLAGLFSLNQVGDGSPGFTGNTYMNGSDRPVMEAYTESLSALACPSDREDRFYGNPYTPLGNLNYAHAAWKRPAAPNRPQDVVSYNISYLYVAGLRTHGNSNSPSDLIWADDTNGPDLGAWAWYGAGMAAPGGTTPNAAAAGTLPGSYAKADNHGKGLGHGGFTDGHAVAIEGSGSSRLFWTGNRPGQPRPPGVVID
jgi:prepilin-type N-terminal cleavage/methylation domain-containing protein